MKIVRDALAAVQGVMLCRQCTMSQCSTCAILRLAQEMGRLTCVDAISFQALSQAKGAKSLSGSREAGVGGHLNTSGGV